MAKVELLKPASLAKVADLNSSPLAKVDPVKNTAPNLALWTLNLLDISVAMDILHRHLADKSVTSSGLTISYLLLVSLP